MRTHLGRKFRRSSLRELATEETARAMLCYAMLCYAMLCYAMLRNVLSVGVAAFGAGIRKISCDVCVLTFAAAIGRNNLGALTAASCDVVSHLIFENRAHQREGVPVEFFGFVLSSSLQAAGDALWSIV